MAIAMAATPKKPALSQLPAAIQERNRTWLRMFTEWAMTAQQIASMGRVALRTVQDGLKWARENPEDASKPKPSPEEQRYDAKLTRDALKYYEKYSSLRGNPEVQEFLASLRPRRPKD